MSPGNWFGVADYVASRSFEGILRFELGVFKIRKRHSSRATEYLSSDAVKTQKTRTDSDFTAIFICKFLRSPWNLTQELTFLTRIPEVSGSNLGEFTDCPWAGIATRYGMDGPGTEYWR